jgi:hypothetical protein
MIQPIGTVKKIVLNRVMEFKEAGEFEGEYLTEELMRKLAEDNGSGEWLVSEDTDAYKRNPDGTEELIFVFRKGVINPDIAKEAVDMLRKTAQQKKINRGSFAGKLDHNKMPAYVGDFFDPSDFRTRYYSNTSGKLGNQFISNQSPSNIVGFFDKADRNLLGAGSNIRAAAFIRDYPEKWDRAVPYFQQLSAVYKELFNPLNGFNPYKEQEGICKKIPTAIIKDTVFSTATINYSCPSALHTDKGNAKEGFAVLNVIKDHLNPNDYTGCYLCLPEFGICIDNNHLDICIGDNKNVWHGTTEFKQMYDEIFPMNRDKPQKMPNEQEINNYWYLNRFVSVSYVRDSILKNYENRKIKSEIDSLGVE